MSILLGVIVAIISMTTPQQPEARMPSNPECEDRIEIMYGDYCAHMFDVKETK